MLLPHQPSGQPERLPACLNHFPETLSLWEKSFGFPHNKAEEPDLCRFKTEKTTKVLNPYLCKQFM